MREIKFRAWDKQEKHFINVCQFTFDAPTTEWQIAGYTDADWAVSGGAENIILMQYTGLKDKNGKEIYEGDIFNCKRDKSHPDGGYIAGTMDYQSESAEVVTLNNGCFFAGDDYLHDRLFWYERHHWDLIGNIYENSDLLDTPIG